MAGACAAAAGVVLASLVVQEPVRQRVQTESRPQGGNAGGNPSQTVAIKNPARLEDNFSVARSPHDARFEERDFFKGLVEHTASNLIDVSQTAEFLSPAEAEARRQVYDAHTKSVSVDQRMRTLFALPETSAAGAHASLAELLDAKHPLAADVALAAKTAQAVQASLGGIRVNPIGNIVVALPDIKAE